MVLGGAEKFFSVSISSAAQVIHSGSVKFHLSVTRSQIGDVHD
jgi:hypothetical protein